MSILRHSGNNLGHFTKLRIAKSQDLDSIQINFQKKVVQPILFKTDKDFIEVYFTEKSLNAHCALNRKQGTFYTNVVSAFIPKHRTDVVELLEELAADQVVLLLTDTDGNDWVVGNKDEPMDLTFKTTLAGKAGYNLTITGESLYGAILYAPL